MLINTANYTYSPNHATLADVPATTRVGAFGTLSGKTSTNGIADASDVQFGSISAGTIAQACIIAKRTMYDNTSALIAYYDAGVGLPVTTDGGPLTIQWDNGTNRIFAL